MHLIAGLKNLYRQGLADKKRRSTCKGMLEYKIISVNPHHEVLMKWKGP